jgi:hypothetical protein
MHKITSINKIPYAGPVYNFQVDEDESYLANGIIVHNCRCIVTAVMSELDTLNDDDDKDEADDNDDTESP